MPQAPRRGARDVVAALTVVEGSGFGVFGRPGGMRWTAGIEKKASLLFSRGLAQKNGRSFSLGSECLVRMIRTSYTYT